MKMRLLFVLILMCLAIMLSAQATDLLFSEYVEGTSFQKALEIFNGTGAAVDLSQYSLKKQTNGAGAFGSELTLTGSLANNDVYVIVNSASGGTNLAGQPYVDLATTNQCANFNGNDAVALYHNGVQIDVIGLVDDPTIWGADLTWVRNSDIASPTTAFSLDQWTAYPINTFTYLGAHTFTGGSPDPVIIVSNPNTAVTWYVGQTYTIAWSSANITGNVKIELDNGEVLTTLAADVENNGSWTWDIPEDHEQGTQFKIKVSTLDGTVSDESNEFFTIAVLPIVDVATISALRASTADGTTIYRLTGEALLTYQQTYRFKKYIMDNTGAIEIDDPNGIITTTYTIGDGITNLTGKLSVYHNLMQFTPFVNPGAATSTGNTLTPVNVTINELNTNFAPYQSQLIHIQNATFLDTSAPFATGIAYNISDGTGQIVFRTNFYDADYIGQSIPTGPVNITAITTQYDTGYQVTSRFLADFSTTANDDQTNENPVVLLGNYPNPFNPNTNITFNIKSAQTVNVNIFNTKGQLVRTLKSDVKTVGENHITWDAKDANGKNVSAGIYFYNIKSDKLSACKKMILVK